MDHRGTEDTESCGMEKRRMRREFVQTPCSISVYVSLMMLDVVFKRAPFPTSVPSVHLW